MKDATYFISLLNLSIMLIPCAIVALFYYRWQLKDQKPLYSLTRMIVQLLLVGYCLSFIFTQHNVIITLGVVVIMILFATWIALRVMPGRKKELLFKSFLAIILSFIPIYIITTFFVINLDPWHNPRYLIPLAGMMLARSVDSVSLSAERFFSEKDAGHDYLTCRFAGFKSAMIPTINSLVAVGIVFIPGMMTGQILSGIDPLIAVRYQILVMTMIFSVTGLSAVIFLKMNKFER
ncbi:MAG: ABC transporter permease [Fibrobacterales bacterium]